jgi:hypothetical protein
MVDSFPLKKTFFKQDEPGFRPFLSTSTKNVAQKED